MMGEQERNPAVTPTLASIEAESFGALAEFGTKLILLLRDSSLNDDNRKVVGERLDMLLKEINAEIRINPTITLGARLDSAYADVQLLVDDLSTSQGNGGTTGGR